MQMEISKEIQRLAKDYRGEKMADAVIVGMAFAILSDTQGDEMVSYLKKWIEENN